MSKPVTVKPFPVEEEYKKKNGITPEDISVLRQWLDTQPHLPGELLGDLDLILTYHCCDRSFEVTKQVLDLHFTLRTLFAITKNRVVDEKLIRCLHIYLTIPLEIRSHTGSAIFYARLIDYDIKKFVFQDGVSVRNCENEKYLPAPPNDVYVCSIFFVQEAMLVKLKALHFMNAPSFMDRLLMIIKPFMKKSLIDMLVIHQIGSKTIEKYLSMDGLPKECGGKFKSLNEARDDLIERFKLNANYFIEENKRRVVESKRPGKPKTISDIFGSVEGTFKKLEID
ncbi:uncharacterized protein LOC113226235 [Hyposmocoma kahamanoa]|uniref:uncharacterized protein LOC113226235 n=1 Tax=Hyposmocoma kahamanoa TaxID=1477025 RepID=UPI000E6D9F32|nr:uncharacterized protein LOC113226235 [Hyposmocoma kahamanoa]